MKKNLQISLGGKRGRIRLEMAFGDSLAVTQPVSVGPLTDDQIAKLTAKLAAKESLSPEDFADTGLTFDKVNPVDADFIYPQFRALSATVIPGYFLDFTKDGVLKAAVDLLKGQTVYTNHCYWRVENWIGAVNQSTWDAKGDKVGGVPGINVELKIDWKMNPKIARGLLMKPPAIHSVSATIGFEWDASHPDLLEQGIFFRNLGQDIDGDIVRIVVTKIEGCHEMSLVYQGANPESNEHLPWGDEDENGDEEMSAGDPENLISFVKTSSALPDGRATARKPKGSQSQTADDADLEDKEKTKVKLTPEQKKALGLEAQTGDEFEDSVVLTAVDSLTTRVASAETKSTSAQTIIDAERVEIVRLATISEGVIGDDKQVKLPDVLAEMIAKADASQLPGLKALYGQRVDAKFQPKCATCGSTEVSRRSSVEEGANMPVAKAPPVPQSTLL
jgi:hypothetical protein